MSASGSGIDPVNVADYVTSQNTTGSTIVAPFNVNYQNATRTS